MGYCHHLHLPGDITHPLAHSIGDVARNTEGSGLGLEIARNLTVMQKGTFDIQLDGDLFKVDLEFETI